MIIEKCDFCNCPATTYMYLLKGIVKYCSKHSREAMNTAYKKPEFKMDTEIFE